MMARVVAIEVPMISGMLRPGSLKPNGADIVSTYRLMKYFSRAKFLHNVEEERVVGIVSFDLRSDSKPRDV